MDKGFHEGTEPGGEGLKRFYISAMLFIVGRAISAAARFDKDVRRELESIGDDYVLSLGVRPSGPRMLIGREAGGRVRYLGSNPAGRNITIEMGIKNLDAAMLMFTFRESSALASTRSRIFLNGGIAEACSFMRVLDRVEVYLLPKFIARLAVKRYPNWKRLPPLRKHTTRVKIYAGAIIGL